MSPPTATATLTAAEQVDKIVNKYNASAPTIQIDLTNAEKINVNDNDIDLLPETTKARLTKYGIDLSKGYPFRPSELPLFLDDAYKIRNVPNTTWVDRGTNADPEKKALFAKVKEVKHLTKHIGTELVGLDLGSLNKKELDELALLISERVVVAIKDIDLSPQKHLELGYFWGADVEKHPLQAQALPGITVVWHKYNRGGGLISFQKGTRAQLNHQDLSHELNSASITHLHLDSIPDVGGDTQFYSGYAAYDKLSKPFQQFLDGKNAVYKSAHRYYDRDDLLGGPKNINREHPLIITHPVTGWKSLNYNPAHTVRIVGLEPEESELILNYLNDIYTKNLDIQVRIPWQPTKKGLGTSVIWDNRISQHVAIADYNDQWEGPVRHAHRVTSLTKPVTFDPESKSQREALGLAV
ncbi:hypothetical protein WICMUC_002169 [Wickerhamomyces mucosus]|uniref:TauD/TfdA-like domain-containing protein n=1 Tax=Wickerhamomyces mucosus TaxID=1378264 RepID=A0A9P8PQC6_9ASCO|nr:hypothetical protein WICMUC_002169 [Wickerhamomyces mucosus]